MTFRNFITAFLLLALGLSIALPGESTETKTKASSIIDNKEDMHKVPDSYWKNKLKPDVYQVTRCSATEAPFTGLYWNNHEPGIYRCSNCQTVLFQSNDKFDSGTGWPSFTKAQTNAVDIRLDKSLGMQREEVVCKHCGAHLGHLFDDGPTPTGQRYCINSASLNFQEQKNRTPNK